MMDPMDPHQNNKLVSLFYYLNFCVVLILASPIICRSNPEQAPVKIGVLAIRGPQQCLHRWSPTAEYLTRQITGHRFKIAPLRHDQIYSHVQSGEVDFILANSALYVGLERWYQANRIVTMKERHLSGVYTNYGGVIFCRRDRIDIRTPNDLKGKTFMAVSEFSLGGWLAALRELRENGIDPQRDCKALYFGENHDRVVEAVKKGRVDAGTVRTNTLEELSAEGIVDLNDFYVFPSLQNSDSSPPYLYTTREYPNWPLAKVQHTPNALAEKVAVALLQLSPDSPASNAAGCAGWTIPLNYQPAHNCLKELKLGPYTNMGKISFTDVLRSYGHWVFFTCAAFFVLAAFTGAILKLNRRIKSSHVRLKTEIDLHRQKDRELQQAKEIAETATRAKSEFLANMSHEIRTPMNGVMAATDLALGEVDPSKVEHYLKIIQSSAYSLLGIINDILDFSKIEAGKFELKERIFRLNEVFDRVMEIFVNKAAAKGIELLVDTDPNLPKVLLGDPLRLQQVLTNLISNAIKFTESGGVILIEVKQQNEANADHSVDNIVLEFSVKDTGCGIAPEYIDMLFEPFSQADTSSTRRYEGTGLGLSICKQLVTLMGGEIDVETRLGVGSTFFFFVRMLRATDKPVGAALVVPPDIQGLNVLVVDDLTDSRIVMRNMLESLSFRVQTARSGQEALSRLENNILRSNPIELIMMDWKMPEMDGIEASRKIRKKLNVTMPIIMMTAFGREEQRIEAEKAGINGFLTKPIYPSTLFDAIMDGFGKEGVRGTYDKRQFMTKASLYRKPLRGIRILVAEDNLTNQQVAQAILEKAGIKVTIVGNGAEAVAAVGEEHFDAVLMDIQMPKMNGYEATQRIRKQPRGVSVPIVAMTAHAMKGDEEKCLEAGMDGYISKPVSQDHLFHTLWRLLRTRKDFPEVIGSEDDEPASGLVQKGGEDEPLHSCEKRFESPPPLPEKLTGLDVAGALDALEIDGATYLRIVMGFGSDNRETGKELELAWVRKDREQLLQLAHGLKGSAANIGANELHGAAKALENACREAFSSAVKQPDQHNLIENVKKTLDRVLQSIQGLAEGYTDHSTGLSAEDTGLPLSKRLEALKAAVAQADPEQILSSMVTFRQQAAYTGAVTPSCLKTLEDQIAGYDYDQALKTLEKITPKCQEGP